MDRSWSNKLDEFLGKLKCLGLTQNVTKKSCRPNKPQFELFDGRFKFRFLPQITQMNTDYLNLNNLLPNISLIKCSLLLTLRVVINSFSNTRCSQAHTVSKSSILLAYISVVWQLAPPLNEKVT